MAYKRLIGMFTALAVISVIGMSGYVFIERWSPLEAFYMTVITLSTVGFMEVHPLSESGRIFTMFLILCGSGILIYCVSLITAFIVEGQLTDAIRRRKMNKRIKALKDHYIVCGADQTGLYVIDELVKTKQDFVVIERDAENIRHLMNQDVLYIEGDASHYDVLQQAGILRAKGFITSLPTDAENLFVVLTAKKLNPSLRVISKAVEAESEQKIRMVGADGVVMPNFIGGLRMVSEMIRPSIVNFLDIMLRAKDKTIRIDEIDLAEGSPLAGKSIGDTGILDREGVTVVALRDRREDSYLFNPSCKTVLNENNIIVVMGNIDIINKIKEEARPEEQ
jgi:voltage-gated potassium channel